MDGEIELKKCGVRFQPPAILITYSVKGTNKLHLRRMPLRNFKQSSTISRVAEDLKKAPDHKRYLEKLPTAQLEKLIAMIQDRMKGMNKEDIIKKAKSLDLIDPEEDLNKVDDNTLKMKKAIMDQTFEKNRKRPDDPDFKYDVEVDFEPGPIETCDWDSDKDSDGGF